MKAFLSSVQYVIIIMLTNSYYDILICYLQRPNLAKHESSSFIFLPLSHQNNHDKTSSEYTGYMEATGNILSVETVSIAGDSIR